MARTLRRTKQLGEILIDEGLIDGAQLETALSEQERRGRSLGRVLVDLGFVNERDLVAALARQVGLEFVDLADYEIDPSATALVPEQVARRYRALPVRFEDDQLVVAMSDPANVFALDDIRTITGMDVRAVVATASDVDAAISQHAQFDQAAEEMVTEASTQAPPSIEEVTSVEAAVEDAPIVKLVNLLITRAVSDRASDIHIEPRERDVRIRFRIDGVLHEVMRPPRNILAGLVSRLKIMADIDIALRRVPQDGRVSLVVGGKAVDLRMVTLPSVHGEKVVIRILDKNSVLLRLEDLGFSPLAYERYEENFRKPYGTILVTGPTGSGKSTTLYATINILNTEDRNIITIEDPVEYRLPGVNQMQVHSKAGLTFATALRHILRGDPDIILVGEIRDTETAVIGVEAALTGHLVLSTLHTNDAASAITRLFEMGVEPYLVASALDCLIAQRLARLLCDRCKEAYEPSEAELVVAGFGEEERPGITELYRSVGCGTCSRTGYRGRIALFEVMPITEEIERLTAERAPTDEIRKMAIAQGMVPLRRDGLEKVRAGVTSLEEVFRVVT